MRSSHAWDLPDAVGTTAHLLSGAWFAQVISISKDHTLSVTTLYVSCYSKIDFIQHDKQADYWGTRSVAGQLCAGQVSCSCHLVGKEKSQMVHSVQSEVRMRRRCEMKRFISGARVNCLLLMLVIAQLVAACDTPSANLTPVEEEQIKNVVTDYYVRETSIPDQEVEIQEVAGNWARVGINATGIEAAPNLLFLQNHVDAAINAPAVQTTVQPGNQASVTTTTGWTIILGPQVNFTQEELDAAGIPAEIRQ